MNRKNTTKRRIGLLIIALGLGFLLYPLTSILVNNLQGERRMEAFRVQESQKPQAELDETLAQAEAYNAKLDGSADGAVDPFEVKNYATVIPLSYDEGEVFGYLSVPKIDEILPIYIGASEYHLSLGVAQVDGTYMPIGVENTRSVIAGHRGFTTQAMFRNMEKMEAGDRVYITALGKTLEYEVYDMEVIEPSEYQKLAVVPGQDTLTLLTCTPYMVNTQRLLVNAVRVEEPEPVATEPAAETEGITEAATEPEPKPQEPSRRVVLEKYALMGIVAVLWLLLLVVIWKLIGTFRRKKDS